ncbi:MAG TPA: hypothetical protein PKX28_01255 [Candidatus Hydrogenedentes bacterium]|nr:hypothetical protein [Candidatus Hydrogenedentota bacterium]HOJ69007.1 hypothetical protein [Candidatus Hydrogenedentota bacterium]HOK89987.1 hypothetical protein [Candidatus Hydrogenedentota bacterium]HPO29838.1 hypothetical protein [Candidatus Hydrogenedentota bacterium]
MLDEFRPYGVDPVGGKQPIDRLEGGGNTPGPRPKMALSIPGRIIAIRRSNINRGGGHTFDVTVGAEEYTEIVLRVPTGAYANLMGKRAVLYIDE